MKNLSYASVYNKLWKTYVSNKEKNVFLLQLKMCKTVREKYWVSKHLIKIYKTQLVGCSISREEIEYLKAINNLASIATNMRLRKLQKSMLEHLYRPNGNISKSFEKDALENFPDLVFHAKN